MIDERQLIEHALHDLPEEPDPIEAIYRRRDRRRRNQRLTSAIVALALAAALAGGLAEILRADGDRTPASTFTVEDAGRLHLLWQGQMDHVAGGGYNITEPVVHDGRVFVLGERMYAFPTDCRPYQGRCLPEWRSSEGYAIWPPSIGEDEVYTWAPRSGFLPSPAPRSHPDRLAAYPLDCADHGDLCPPAWVANLRTDTYSSRIEAVDGMVFVATPGRLVAFPQGCASDAGECAPSWRGVGPAAQDLAMSLAVGDGVVLEGIVTSEGDAEVVAFSTSCSSETCEPLWVARPVLDAGAAGGRVSAPYLAAADGMVYAAVAGRQPEAGLSAYRADCGSGGSICSPEWTWSGRLAGSYGPTSLVAGEDHVVLEAPFPGGGTVSGNRFAVFPATCASPCRPAWIGDGAKVEDGTPTIAGGMVFVQGEAGTSAFALDCRTDGGVCDPMWVGRAASSPVEYDGHVERPVVAGDLVFAAPGDGHLVFAFPTDCADPCAPLWQGRTHGRIRSAPVVDGKTVLVATGDGRIVAFGVSSSTRAPIGGTPLPLWLGIVVLAIVGAFARVWFRRRAA
jgi:outer membrane protein assembly factor BamB